MSDLQDLASVIKDLVQPGHHIELYPLWRNNNRVIVKYETDHLPLMAQLRAAATDRPTSEPNTRQHTVPHLDLDAVDRLTAIEKAVNKWLAHNSVKSRAHRMAAELTTLAVTVGGYPRGVPREVHQAAALLTKAAETLQRQVEWDMPALVSMGAQLEQAEVDELVADASRWRTWCRIFGGWETAPWKPHVRCPLCDDLPGPRKGLRVRFRAASAVCLSCEMTWDSRTITTLAAYVTEVQRVVRTTTPVGLTQNRGQ